MPGVLASLPKTTYGFHRPRDPDAVRDLSVFLDLQLLGNGRFPGAVDSDAPCQRQGVDRTVGAGEGRSGPAGRPLPCPLFKKVSYEI